MNLIAQFWYLRAPTSAVISTSSRRVLGYTRPDSGAPFDDDEGDEDVPRARCDRMAAVHTAARVRHDVAAIRLYRAAEALEPSAAACVRGGISARSRYLDRISS